MNKKELIKEVSKRARISKHISKIVIDCLMENIALALKQGSKVSMKNFGTFRKIEKRGKRYYDISKGKIRTSQTKKVVKFIPAKRLKGIIGTTGLDVHAYNDGSIGNYVTIEKQIFTTRDKIENLKIPTTNKSRLGKENLGKRIIHKTNIEDIKLTFDGSFLFDHFVGEGEHQEFPSIKVPQKDTPILMPQVDNFGVTEGIMEPVLREHINIMCRDIDGIKLLENVRLPILNRNYSYRPDFCLFWEKKKLYIDIEIDEPYDIVSRKPIHYQGNGDNLRDRYFIRNGWCVIRLAEQQVKEDIDGVINYVKRVLRWLTEERRIKIHENTLSSIARWTYEDAITMSSNNAREHYLNLPDYIMSKNPQTIQNISDLQHKHTIFKKPDEDVLPKIESISNEHKWVTIIEELKQSKGEYCRLTRANGYQWVYMRKSIHIKTINRELYIKGQSPLGIDAQFSLKEVFKIEPLDNLFSNVYWEEKSTTSSDNFNILKEILYDAIAKGKPLWVAYHSNNSGYSERILSNIVYAFGNTPYSAPHIGLGHYKKHGIHSLSHFHAYCSNRKEFRMFAADDRIKKIKVLNCNHVYFVDGEYANSFAQLVMSPYDSCLGNAFFENANEILNIMPKYEFESTYVQGNLANLYVMTGEIDKAILIYNQKPYDFFLEPSLTWGEVCLSDIRYFINLCKEHINDSYFYDGLNAKKLLKNFEEVLSLLTESSWYKVTL